MVQSNDAEDVEQAAPTTTTTTNAGYDYLLRAPLWNLTRERIEQLREKHKKKRSELDALQKKQPTDIWHDELSQLGDFLVHQAKRSSSSSRKPKY
jgi:hypothetical protein